MSDHDDDQESISPFWAFMAVAGCLLVGGLLIAALGWTVWFLWRLI